MRPTNKQICHFCVAGDILSRSGGFILKLPILTVDPNTNNILDKIELFCKGESASLLKSLDFKKGDYGYCEGNVTFSKGNPSDIDPTILKKMTPGEIKFTNLHYDETNSVLYTHIRNTRVDYDDLGNKVNWVNKIDPVTTAKSGVLNNVEKYENRKLSIQSRLNNLLAEND